MNRPSPLLNRQRHRLALFWLLAGLFSSSYAQDLPAPGGQSGSSVPVPLGVPSEPESSKNQGTVLIPQRPTTDADKAAQAPQALEQQNRTQLINQIQFVGNQALSSAALLDVIWPDSEELAHPAQALNFKQMQEMANRITSFYRDSGYLAAKAVLPAQDITGGVLTIQVLEGRLDQIRVNSSEPNIAERINDVLATGIPRGEALERSDIERSLILAGELSNEKVTAQLQPGEGQGTTTLVVDSQPLPATYGAVTVDNYGTPSIGQVRFTADLGLNSGLILGDKLSVEVGTSDSPNLSRRYDVSYDLPLGVQGLSGGVRAWQSNYSLGGVFSPLGAVGIAQAQGLHLGYALVRSNNAKADVRAGYNWITSNDQYLATGYSNPRYTHAGWADVGGWYDDDILSSYAHNNWLLGFTSGFLNLVNPGNQLLDNLANKTQGQYNFLSYALSREQSLGSGFSGFGNARGQQADHNLDGYYKYSLGGPTAVRAYPVGEIVGDDATILTGELRYTTPINFDDLNAYVRFSAFYDWGMAKINQFPLAAQLASNKAIRAGYGFGGELGLASNVNARIYWAKTTDSVGYSYVTGKTSVVGMQMTAGF